MSLSMSSLFVRRFYRWGKHRKYNLLSQFMNPVMAILVCHCAQPGTHQKMAAPHCIWTLLSRLGERTFFSILVEEVLKAGVSRLTGILAGIRCWRILGLQRRRSRSASSAHTPGASHHSNSTALCYSIWRETMRSMMSPGWRRSWARGGSGTLG